MLYKKYHRNYVRRFKKGVEVEFEQDLETIDRVIIEPSIMKYGKNVYIGYNDYWILIESDGKLMKYNVIQKISQKLC